MCELNRLPIRLAVVRNKLAQKKEIADGKKSNVKKNTRVDLLLQTRSSNSEQKTGVYEKVAQRELEKAVKHLGKKILRKVNRKTETEPLFHLQLRFSLLGMQKN